ncbi:hypothetical protein [Acidiplasma sp.]|uniref:hypothetical protein n=1 Tax=Acidiplasma sp. TaxID=1872114 RepID=UPI003169D50A
MKSYTECFEELKDDPLSAAECIHCLQKHGEVVIFSDEKKRLILWREEFDNYPVPFMEKISQLLEIHTRDDYEKMDKKFNLTMY